MKKFIIAILFLLAIIFVFSRFTEVTEMVDILQRAQPEYLALALLAEGLWLLNVGLAYRVNYRLLDMDKPLKHMVLMSAAANNFVGIIAPSGGMSALAVFLGDAKRNEHSSARVTVACLLYLLFDYIGLLGAVLLGLLVLVRRNRLDWAEITAASILALVALAILMVLYVGFKRPERLGKSLAWLAKKANWLAGKFKRKKRLDVAEAYSFAEDISAGVAVLRANPRQLVIPVILGMTNKGLLITVLLMLFLAFGVPVSGGTVIGGFALGYLFTIVSLTPSGIGMMEGVMALVLRSLGVNLEEAAILTLAFRAITFWLPFIIGMAAFRFLFKEPRTEP
ncbi:hypothetical protein ADN00_14565 [Ornatilinea apprima]|uniref:Uncharacterized protein n=1 Tax=Ornatilinea apprima TaxID=1134406 RepID=A0A0P6WTJ4_9CHLR|nr:lysylphosphatidylglycerol synthase transmembrane domain-containing protein [Ornatilinea apprima]KPL73563.1 hypothetical protein ADN00_14565 [Ornatilinea apprima]